jgi:hypothetical protein
VTVAKDLVDAAKILNYLTILIIIIYYTCCFSICVAFNARYGFWRDKLAKIVPVFEHVNKLLYFDLLVIHQIIEKGQKGIKGVKVVK